MLCHIKAVAPTAITKIKLAPRKETNPSALCKVCGNVLHSPLMLVCSHHMCADCLCFTLQQTGRIMCPVCSVVCPLTNSSVVVPSPLLVDLLADQLAECSICKGAVQLKHFNEHKNSGCKAHQYLSIQQILEKPLSSTLTRTEERVGSNIVRRWFHASENNVVTVPTGGPV